MRTYTRAIKLNENIKKMMGAFYFVEHYLTCSKHLVKTMKTLHCVNVARRMIFPQFPSVIESATTQLRGYEK
ncbi:hypothetical protein KUL150_37760 [Alteromonas sp. KUL150]|nr:hypothetical protein KUL150_37760 [Alteromonas sp. KUL150]